MKSEKLIFLFIQMNSSFVSSLVLIKNVPLSIYQQLLFDYDKKKIKKGVFTV